MDWYLYQDGTQWGPYSEKDFRQMVLEGRIRKDDHVWNQQLSDWVPAGQVAGLLDGAAGQPPQEQAQPSHLLSEKESILKELLAYSDAGPFRISRGDNTDLKLTNEIMNSSWFTGKKKVTYTAQILLKESEKTAYYWEMLKESSAGFSLQVGGQKGKIKGLELFQQIKAQGYSPTGEAVYDYQFDYGSLREAFRSIIENNGWKFKTVLFKGKASY